MNGSAIPDVDFDIGESYAGLLPVSQAANETKKLFFWYAYWFSSCNAAKEKRNANRFFQVLPFDQSQCDGRDYHLVRHQLATFYALELIDLLGLMVVQAAAPSVACYSKTDPLHGCRALSDQFKTPTHG